MLIMSQAILDDIFQSCWVFFHVLILVKYQIFCWVLLRLTIRIWFSWNGKLDKTDSHLLTADGAKIFISTITLTMDALILANYPVHLFRALSLWEAAATSLVILITITVKLFHSRPFPPENNWLAHFSAKCTDLLLADSNGPVSLHLFTQNSFNESWSLGFTRVSRISGSLARKADA